jgi:O-antigen/teichoic acid export membrane protein
MARLQDQTQQVQSQHSSLGLSLTSNFIWTLIGNVVYTGCQWSVVVALAKIANPEVVGQFALALAVAFPITYIANLQLRTLFVTDLDNKYPFYEMLGLRCVLSGVAMIAVFITCRITGYGASMSRVIFVVALAQLVDCLSESYYGIFQRDERLDRISVSLIMRHLVGASALITAVYFTHSLLLGVSGLVFGRGVVLLLYDARYGAPDVASARRTLFACLTPRWDPRTQLRMVWIALPLGIASVLVSVNGNVPRYVVEHFLGRRELGIYSAISYIPAGATMIGTALGFAVFARLAKLFSNGEVAAFRTLLIKTGGICLGLGLAGFIATVVAGRQLLVILYRPEYAEHVNLLRLLMIVGAVQFLLTCLGCALTAASQFRVQVPLFLGITATSVLGCVTLVPRMGLLGAAIAVLISAIVQLLSVGFVMLRALERRARTLRQSDSPFTPLFEIQQ